jgi:hypothetical protein
MAMKLLGKKENSGEPTDAPPQNNCDTPVAESKRPGAKKPRVLVKSRAPNSRGRAILPGENEN